MQHFVVGRGRIKKAEKIGKKVLTTGLWSGILAKRSMSGPQPGQSAKRLIKKKAKKGLDKKNEAW